MAVGAFNMCVRWGKWPSRWVILPLLLLGEGRSFAQEPAKFYGQNCAACHSIGGGAMVGPDLKDVLKRKDRQWLIRFMENPQAVVDSGDAYARDLVSASGGLVMPAVPGLDKTKADALLDYIDAHSNQEQKASATKQAAEEKPFTPADVEAGKEIFLGRHPLAAGGAPCISCHTAGELPRLGGGRLGPDLQRSYERLGGRNNMKAWLSSPPTPTMQTVYRAHALEPTEILSLIAYFQAASKDDATHPTQAQSLPFVTFLLIGLGGSLAALVVMDELWRKRFRAVRRPLVSKRKG